MRPIPHEARHQVTRFEILAAASFSHRKTLPLKITAQVWHPPMVDVFVRFFQPPILRILIERRSHILVHQLLQIHRLPLPHRPNDHVRTDASILRNIAPGISQAHVGRVINCRHTNLRPRRRDNRRIGSRFSRGRHTVRLQLSRCRTQGVLVTPNTNEQQADNRDL